MKFSISVVDGPAVSATVCSNNGYTVAETPLSKLINLDALGTDLMAVTHHCDPVPTSAGSLVGRGRLCGLATAIPGGLLLARPADSLVVLAVLVGGALIARLVFVIVLNGSAAVRFLLIFGGPAAAILATLDCRDLLRGQSIGHGAGVLFLANWLGLVLIFCAAAVAAGRGRPFRVSAMFAGAATFVGGLIVLAYPVESIADLALVTGAVAVAVGAVEFGQAFAMRADPDVNSFELSRSASRVTGLGKAIG
jgi:uncharacterized membrane protein HdeD (DUF308 family)